MAKWYLQCAQPDLFLADDTIKSELSAGHTNILAKEYDLATEYQYKHKLIKFEAVKLVEKFSNLIFVPSGKLLQIFTNF